MLYQIKKANYALDLEVNETSAKVVGGRFHDVNLIEGELFSAILECPSTGEEKRVTSLSAWNKVDCRVMGNTYALSFSEPEGCADIVFLYTAVCDDKGIDWHCEIINDSPVWSVGLATYPTVKVAAEPLEIFTPEDSGRHLSGTVDYDFRYPATDATMQYFAFWSKEGGIYLGYHDPDANQKDLHLHAKDGNGSLVSEFPAINAGVVENSFALGGFMRWEAFSGDWYDATMLYADFVWNHAKWLPAIEENGRPDTAEKYKEIPFWITDYIPNSPEQMEARPMILGAVSQLYDANYWFEAPIELRKRLGVPVAYHVYNWHHIPFNINYPHYTPAKEEFFRGAQALKDAGLLLMPYINAVSWEEKDADEGYAINFANTGYQGVATKEDGTYCRAEYPQVKRDGSKTQLMPMCPCFAPWHKLIEQEARTIEATMPVDGIYFDEVAAHRAHPCRGKGHGHLPGGGSYWSDGYNLMMSKINRNKPKEAFYFTECNAEPYMKSFDGYLTWLWRDEGAVPAFPAIYAGYIQMVGRFTDGVNREDDLLFRYHTANALLYGQQLGWCNAAVIYREARMQFLEKMVHLRYDYTKVFNSGRLCRPPKVDCSLSCVVSSGLSMEQVVSGAWKNKADGKITLFVINVAQEACDCTVSFDYREYGLDAASLPKECTLSGNLAILQLHLDPLDSVVKEF